MALGKPINRWINLELRGSYESLSGERSGVYAGGGYDNIPFGIDALVFFRRTGLQPFLILGGGGIREQTGGSSAVLPTGVVYQPGRTATGWMANAGVGLLYPFNDTVSGRIDASLPLEQQSHEHGYRPYWRLRRLGRIRRCEYRARTEAGAATAAGGSPASSAPAAAPAACTAAGEAAAEEVRFLG